MRRVLVPVTGLALLTTACGGGGSFTENLAEEAIEQSLENELEDGGVELDFDEEDGLSIEFEDDGGSGSFSSGGDLPDDLPVGVPDGGEVVSVLESDSDGESFTAVTIQYPEDRYDDLVGYYEEQMAALGDVERFESSSPDTRNLNLNVALSESDSVSVGVNDFGDGLTTVNITEITSGA